MDRIMPIDLERVQLRKSFRGYETAKVDEIVAQSAERLKELLVENASLRETVEQQSRSLERTKLEENTLKDALMMAQKAADETRSAAQKHAEAMIEEARQAASGERMALQTDIADLRWEAERLRGERRRFEDEFRAMLERYQREMSPAPVLSVVEGSVAAVGS